jgi:hypothetical protein
VKLVASLTYRPNDMQISQGELFKGDIDMSRIRNAYNPDEIFFRWVTFLKEIDGQSVIDSCG